MNRFLIFAGTTEGRRLAEELAGTAAMTVCVATDYGRDLLPRARPGLEVRTGRLDEEAMEALLAAGRYDCTVDATHPYAKEVTENIRRACGRQGVPYLRLLRDPGGAQGAEHVADARQAAARLNQLPGNVLLTTGSKELDVFTAVEGYETRLYPRILPVGDAVERAAELGYARGHIIAMQGPFSLELNVALLRQFHIGTLVTKDGGKPGGFAEKQQAARQAGARLLVIGRPAEPEEGYSYGQVLNMLRNWGDGQ